MMDHSSFEDENPDNNSPKKAQSTSFTISFDEKNESVLKQKKIKANMFVRRHIRTFSLPVKSTCPSNKMNGRTTNASDEREVQDVNKRPNSSTFIVDDKSVSTMTEICTTSNSIAKSGECVSCHNNGTSVNVDSESESEGGTYTLDKNNKDLIIARKTIDQVFGISSENATNGKTPSPEEKLASKTLMVGQWIEQSASALKNAQCASNPSIVISSIGLKQKTPISRIPSPVFGHRVVKSKNSKSVGQNVNLGKSEGNDKISSSRRPKTADQLLNSPISGDIDTESYLKETESIVAALHNRLQNDKLCHDVERASPISNTRFNRAFSLRRDRLKKPTSPVISNTAIPVQTNATKPISFNRKATHSNAHTNLNLNARDLKLKSLLTFSPSKPKNVKSENVKNKSVTALKTTGNGIRSASSLSSQEVEFQNWKRRKSYDPLKSVAEDKKKKSMMQSAAGSASMSTAALTKKRSSTNHNEEDNSIEKGIIRSASFHGLRHKNGFDRFMFVENNNNNRKNSNYTNSSCIINKNTSSEILINKDEDDEGDDDDWTMPKPPSTSLQNTPPESLSSRLSLLSHTMSNSSVLLSSSSNTKVNFMTLLSVTQLSLEIRNAILSITDGLGNGIDAPSYSFTSSRNEDCVNCENKTDFENRVYENLERTPYKDEKSDEDEDKIHDSDDDSESNELCGNYQLRMTLNNLKQIQESVQKLQMAVANK